MKEARRLLQQRGRTEEDELGGLMRDRSKTLVPSRSRSVGNRLGGDSVRLVDDQEPDVLHFLEFVDRRERNDFETPAELLVEVKLVRQFTAPLTCEGRRHDNGDIARRAIEQVLTDQDSSFDRLS